MKRKYLKYLSVIFFSIIFLIFSQTISKAASASISASSSNVQVGDKVNINVNINAATWNIKVNGAGISDSIPGYNPDVTNQQTNKSYSLDTSKPGTYTVSLSGDVTDANGTKSSQSGNVTITVKEKQEQPQQQTQQPAQQTPEPAKTQEPAKPAEPTFSNTSKTMYTTGNINLRSSWSTSSAATSVPAGTEVTVTGTSTDKVGGYVWYRVTYNGQTKYVANSLLTSEKPEEEQKEDEKSANKALKELSVEGYELSPEFNPETTKYSLTLKDTDKILQIKATPADEKSTYTIDGNEDFKVGNNIVKITVTAEDGTARIYTITVSKTNEAGEVEGLKLSKLQIANATLEPSFDPAITNYTITVDDPSTIKAESIVAVAEDPDAKVTTAENTQSDSGEKIITVMIESKDGTKTGIYQITVKKPAPAQALDTANNNDNSIYYILGAIIGALIILIIIIIVALKKTSDKEDDEDEDVRNADEMSDDYRYSLKNSIDEANEEYTDDMIKESNYKSQILNTKLNNIKNDDDFGKTRINNFDFDEVEEDVDDFEETPRKKGKHF